MNHEVGLITFMEWDDWKAKVPNLQLFDRRKVRVRLKGGEIKRTGGV